MPTGWVTEGAGLTQNQQAIALGSEMLPLQAIAAFVDASRSLLDHADLLRGDKLHQLGVVGHDVVCDIVAVLLAE